MPEKRYVCPIHQEIVLFKKSRFESLVKIETIPAFCPQCSKYYLKNECVEVQQGEEKDEQASN
jgi:hypothetical protein